MLSILIANFRIQKPSEMSSIFTLLTICIVFINLFENVAANKKPYEKWCQRNCGDYPVRPICATNNATYSNICAMYHYSCETKNEIEVAYKQSCRLLTNCQLEQQRKKEQQKLSRKKSSKSVTMFVHVPKCFKKSGNYFPTQCANGYCWCVNYTTGQFVSGTSAREDAFVYDCSNQGAQIGTPLTGVYEEDEGDKSDCSGEEKKQFTKSINELISRTANVFITNDSSAKLSPVQAMFLELDVDGDGALQKAEIHEYRRNIKLLLPQKVCARTMQLHCDLDENGWLEYSEWLMCVEPSDITDVFDTLHAEDDEFDNRAGEGGPPNNSDIYESDEFLSIDEDSIDNPRQVDLDPNEDCFGRRASQIRRNINPLLECESDGRFKSIQCSEVQSTRICWCVDQNSGHPIKRRGSGRIVKAKDPESLNCNTVKRNSLNEQECSGEVLKTFSETFLATLSTILEPNNLEENAAARNAISSFNNTFWTYSTFKLFDKNPEDSFLDKTELSSNSIFSEKLSVQNIRVCSETIVERCDLNRDDKLSQYEWNACFNEGNPMLPIE